MHGPDGAGPSRKTAKSLLNFLPAERLSPFGPFRDGATGDDMFLENAFAPFARDRAIPDAFGINQQPRAADADAKAVGLRPHDGEMQLGAPPLQIVPDELPFLRRRAIGSETEKEMPLRPGDPGGVESLGEGSIFRGHLPTFVPPKGAPWQARRCENESVRR